MTESTANLALPYIQPSQAQKHVTHNEALRLLDAVVQLAVPALNETVPPAAPRHGARHLVGAGATLEWAGRDGQLAVYDQTAWMFIAPQTGWRAHLVDEGGDAVFDGSAWVTLPGPAELGINTAASPADRLAVASDATLFTHDSANGGTDHRVKVNKAGPDATASLLFQSGFSGRAEMGLAGNDDFSVKLSADGSGFYQALTLSPGTQTIALAPDGTVRARLSATALALDVPLTGSAVQSGPRDTTPGRVLTTGAFGWGQSGTPATGALNAALSSGLHAYGATDTSRPTAGGGTVLVVRFGAAEIAQSAIGTGETGIWLRRSVNGGTSWTGWSRAIDQGALVGPVSQVAGLPTGRVIERAGNANGQYTRFADGTQICWRAAHPLAGGGGAALSGAWSFPAGFATAPAVLGTLETAGFAASVSGPAPDQVLGVELAAVSALAATLRLRRIAGAPDFAATDSCAVGTFAIGRWF